MKRTVLALALWALGTRALLAAEPYYFPIEVKGLWGYIDETGKVVLPPSYQAAAHFAEGLAPVKIGGLFGYIDIHDSVAVKPQFDEARVLL
jgi:hypothetical protein